VKSLRIWIRQKVLDPSGYGSSLGNGFEKETHVHLPSNNAELLNQNLPGENNNISDADFFNQVRCKNTSVLPRIIHSVVDLPYLIADSNPA